MRLALSVVVFAVFALVAFGNSLGAFLVLRRKRATGSDGGVSLVPLVGGLAGAAGCVIAGAARWAWVPPLVDFGCVPLLAFAAVAAVRKR